MRWGARDSHDRWHGDAKEAVAAAGGGRCVGVLVALTTKAGWLGWLAMVRCGKLLQAIVLCLACIVRVQS